MGLKGFPESSKFRHLFVAGPSALRDRKDYISGPFAGRKGGERSKWF